MQQQHAILLVIPLLDFYFIDRFSCEALFIFLFQFCILLPKQIQPPL